MHTLYDEIKKYFNNDIFLSHVAELTGIKYPKHKYTHQELKKIFVEVPNKKDEVQYELYEIEKLRHIQLVYRMLHKLFCDHYTLMTLVLKNNGEVQKDHDAEYEKHPYEEDLFPPQEQNVIQPNKISKLLIEGISGDHKDDDFEMRTNTEASIEYYEEPHLPKATEPSTRPELDRDFRNFKKYLELPSELWQREVKTMNLKIFKKKDYLKASAYMVKCIINLPGIPKEVAFDAISDINVRRQWDQIVQDAVVLQEDKKHNT